MSKSFSQSDVASHNKTSDLYIIVDEDVYDLTKFQDEHPGKFLLCPIHEGFDHVNTSQVARKVYVPRAADSDDPMLTAWLVLQRVAGKDASKQFWKYHNEGILKKFKGQLQVGSLATKKSAPRPTPPATPPAAEKKEKVLPSAKLGTVAPSPGPATAEKSETLDPYGSIIPFADPSWYQSVRALLSVS